MRSPVLLCALFLLACNRHPAPKPAAPSGMPVAQSQKRGQPQGMTVAGKVLERIDAGPYSYLRLDTLGGEQWAAVPKCEAKAGDPVVVAHAMPMDGFESKTLQRKFEHIVFGMLEGTPARPTAEGEPPAPPHPPAGHPPIGNAPSGPPPNLGPIAVSRASGPHAATVAEVYAKKASLRDKPVRVHAKVVKVLPGIMGKNWLHVRDGSGSDAGKDNDLTVTTDDVVTVGSVVLVDGVVHTDKDLGSGYNFSVLVEDAKVTKD
jgi:hypothetical protein